MTEVDWLMGIVEDCTGDTGQYDRACAALRSELRSSEGIRA